MIKTLLVSALLLGGLQTATTKKTARLRAEPRNGARVVATVPQGTTLQILETAEEPYLAVEYEGQTAYVHKGWVNIRSEPKEAPAPPNEAAQQEFPEKGAANANAREKFTETFMMSGPRGSVHVTITRWTTDEERLELLTELDENGAEGLVKLLRKQKETGFIWSKPAASPSARLRDYPPRERLRYARECLLENGDRRIVLAHEGQGRDRERRRGYNVSVIVMDIDDEGNGEGQLMSSVRLAIDEDKRLIVDSLDSIRIHPKRTEHSK